MSEVLTFRDFSFRAHHSLAGHSAAAAHTHWHSYNVRLWFKGVPDQDALVDAVESSLKGFHGADLTQLLSGIETTDENIASYIFRRLGVFGCVKVTLTNDGCRGAEAVL